MSKIQFSQNILLKELDLSFNLFKEIKWLEKIVKEPGGTTFSSHVKNPQDFMKLCNKLKTVLQRI